MTQSMTYWAARDYIKNGDIVHIHRPKSGINFPTLVYSFIQFFTGSPIYHNVIAMWMTSPSGEKRLMCVEANIRGGKRIIPLSNYSDHRLEVQPLPEQFEFAKIEGLLMTRVGQQAYSLLDFVSIGLREFFGIRAKDFMGQVCSELCADAWMEAGVPLASSLISPGKLKGDLLKLGIEISIDTNI